MDTKEIIISVIVPSAVGILPYFLEKRGVAVPGLIITSGGVLTIAALCFGLFYLTSWLSEKTGWPKGEISQSALISYVLSFSIAAIFISLWITADIIHRSDLTKFPTRQLEVISGKSYLGGTVEVDGKLLENCTFKNVTLLYHGTATYSILNPIWQGPIYLRTDNKAIHDFVTMYEILRTIPSGRATVFDLDEQGNPHRLN